MYAYFLRVGDAPHWSLAVAIFIVLSPFGAIVTGEMPAPEFGITVIADRPLPPDKIHALHLEPLE